MPLHEVAQFSDPMAAELARARLEAAGIAAVAFDSGMASVLPGIIGPIRLMVVDDELDLARSLLASEANPDRNLPE